jgi:signal transduction histidine kinase
MWKRISLRTRILIVLGALVVITVGGGSVSIFYSFFVDRFYESLVEKDLDSFKAAQELQNAIIMQKGYVTYFYQDADPQWLVLLDKYSKDFEQWLNKAREGSETKRERNLLSRLEAQYLRYGNARDGILKLYQEGRREEGLTLHKNVRESLFNIIDLTNEYSDLLKERMDGARVEFRSRARLMNFLVVSGLICVVGLGVILAYLLLNDVLGPIRQLIEVDAKKGESIVGNEVKALSEKIHDLKEDMSQTKSKLKWSREHLQQAEKWALVGKLAAGVAHSVRNPLTSVKMRLFSMERTLSFTPSQKDDFEVISEEIRHIDTIVGNFLEFSRPPKLKMQRVSPSDVVDMSVQLLRHRLESYEVKVEVIRDERLPEISADPDQLKEVLVNLIVNACEAMVDGGMIKIIEEKKNSANSAVVEIIKVSDNGPGIPEAIQEKLFQPFFSTKEEGTGLGLSIATRIVEDHGGWMDIKSTEGQGTTFIINLPQTEERNWEQS